jgi:glycosyltransferase involved in cell wall biosynthesis
VITGAAERPIRWAVVYPRSESLVDGVRDYCDRLAEALDAHPGAEARAVAPSDLAGLKRWPDIVLLQYSPFAFGRWGFAPLLIGQFLRSAGTRAVMVHEPFVPVTDIRSALMGAWQRFQLGAIVLAAHRVFLSVEGWRTRIAGRRREAVHLPVPSNLPDARNLRGRTRLELGAAPDRLVVATLATGHSSQLTLHVRAAVEAIASESPGLLVLNLGAGAASLELGDGVEVVQPGRLSATGLSAHIAAADLCLLPFVDGASTRRGSVMAALQHGIPVISTEGHLSDPVFEQLNGAAWLLSRADDEAGFVRAALEIARDRQRGMAMGVRGRCVYEERFDWPVLVERLMREVPCGS